MFKHVPVSLNVGRGKFVGEFKSYFKFIGPICVHAFTLKSNGEFALIFLDLVILALVFKTKAEYTPIPLRGFNSVN